MIDFKTVEVVRIEDIRHWDAPDYVDAFISEAEIDGVPATDKELDEINANSEFIYQAIIDSMR